MTGIAFFVLLLAALVVNAPAEVVTPEASAFFFLLGGIGLWRYSWWLLHLVRSNIYRRWTFPRWRRVAQRMTPRIRARQSTAPNVNYPLDGGSSGNGVVVGEILPAEKDEPPDLPPILAETFIVITSFRIPTETSMGCFSAAVDEAISCGRPCTIVASIVEMADQRTIKTIFASRRPPSHVRLTFVRLKGKGKREALAAALNAVSRMRPGAGASVIVMDGDTLLPPGTIARTLVFFDLMPSVGGITTDEDCRVRSKNPWLIDWHRLRFVQRHMLMSSLALSKRLMAMTGRLSAFRAEIATDPDFIAIVADDHLEHWRLGRIDFLTGEDKSTWFWLLKKRWDMLYVPDVKVVTIEHPPSERFVSASSQLMVRWFGNMLRTNGRAIRLGLRRMPPFFWWCLIDQRISIWTPLIGPVAVTLLSLTSSVGYIYAYLIWVLATRLLLSLGLLTVRPWTTGSVPILLYYSQVFGAMVKVYVSFRLERQAWTRQNITLETPQGNWNDRVSLWTTRYIHGLSLAALVVLVAMMTGVLAWPGVPDVTLLKPSN
ncbi:MAG: glycosyltransferase [Geminicoccaceae bacterium]